MSAPYRCFTFKLFREPEKPFFKKQKQGRDSCRRKGNLVQLLVSVSGFSNTGECEPEETKQTKGNEYYVQVMLFMNKEHP